MNNKIEKIKYHISTLKDSVNFISIDGLAVKLDFSNAQFDRLFEICDEFDRKIENDKIFNLAEFEKILKDELGIGYQTIKMIIDDFAKYEHFEYLAYAYMLSTKCKAPLVKAKYNKLDKETKDFIDEVVANSRNRGGK